ncbi:MAG: hypothetical protein QF410_15660, partial [Planctomycetota bacterium]|nr:hypothetical protein [Planctomycetota bacterium]
LQGTVELSLATGGSPVGGGQLISGGDATVVPDLHAEVTAPPPLPPWLSFDLAGVHYVFGSDPFGVSATGDFTATNLTVTTTAGTLTLSLAGGTPLVFDMTGLSFNSGDAAGTIVETGGSLRIEVPIDIDASLTDPTTGLHIDLFMLGTLVGEVACALPSTYCQTSPNSVGAGALISSSGGTSITANELVLECAGLPSGQFAIFYYGPDQIAQPFGDGVRCVGGSALRLPPRPTGAGALSFSLDHSALPAGGELEAGDAAQFQCWYRDPSAGLSGFNFSDGLSVTFCP